MDTRLTPSLASSGIGISSVFTPVTPSIRLTDRGPWNPVERFFYFGAGCDRIDEDEVRSRFQVKVAATNSLGEAIDCQRIGTGIDYEVGVEVVPRLGTRSNFANHFLRRDDLLALHVPAAFWETLIFDIHACGPHSDQPLGYPGGIDDISPTGIGIRHHGDTHGLNNVPGRVENIFHLHQANVGLAQQRACDTESRNLNCLKSTAFDDLRAKGIVAAGYDYSSPL